MLAGLCFLTGHAMSPSPAVHPEAQANRRLFCPASTLFPGRASRAVENSLQRMLDRVFHDDQYRDAPPMRPAKGRWMG